MEISIQLLVFLIFCYEISAEAVKAMEHNKKSAKNAKEIQKTIQHQIPTEIRTGSAIVCKNPRSSCKIFSLTDEFPEFMKILYELVNQQEAEGGEKFSVRTMQQLFKQYQDGFLPKQMPKLLDKISGIIQNLRAKYVDKINAKIEEKFAAGPPFGKRKRGKQTEYVWGNTKIAEIRIQNLAKMVAPKFFEGHLDQILQAIRQLGIRMDPNILKKDIDAKLAYSLKLIDEQWDQLPAEFQKELTLKIGEVSIVEENRVILARLLALARNLIRKFLQQNNLTLWNGIFQAYYDENVANGQESRLETVDVVNFVTMFDAFSNQWSTNAEHMDQSWLLSQDETLWPVDLESGEVLRPNDHLYTMEIEMSNGFEVGLTRGYKIASPAPVAPLADDELILLAFDIAVEHAVENPDWPLDVFGFLKNCQNRAEKYRNEAKVSQAVTVERLCERLRYGPMAEALVYEMGEYEHRRIKGAFSYPCAMIKFIGSLFMLSSDVLKKIFDNEQILDKLKFREIYAWCQENGSEKKEEKPEDGENIGIERTRIGEKEEVTSEKGMEPKIMKNSRSTENEEEQQEKRRKIRTDEKEKSKDENVLQQKYLEEVRKIRSGEKEEKSRLDEKSRSNEDDVMKIIRINGNEEEQHGKWKENQKW